ncbi:hypothetical protein [Brevibacillus brevis]|uniref:hypothetical protein n=1 Tax=Brevibacillus brevis TaxID=1393 RepID=UPI0021BD9958|nr:hypothetical protein [Brevibacillus brevis]
MFRSIRRQTKCGIGSGLSCLTKSQANATSFLNTVSDLPILQIGVKGQTKQISPQEDSFGWFESGPYAWEMTEAKRIDPVPAKGQRTNHHDSIR